jgi:hypothetical protein
VGVDFRPRIKKWKHLSSAGRCVNGGNEDFVEIIVVIGTLSPFLI